MSSLYDSVGGGADSAVLALRSHLLEHWTGEGLVLGANLAPIPPFHGYQSTLEPYHAGYQRLNTLVITKRRFKKAFEMIPGLGALAEGAMALMSRVVRTLAFEHENIHVLRQVPGVPCGATFSPHRDDHSLRLLYTLILKLTADPVAAPPSQMQVFEPVEHPPAVIPVTGRLCDHIQVPRPPHLPRTCTRFGHRGEGRILLPGEDVCETGGGCASGAAKERALLTTSRCIGSRAHCYGSA